MTQKYRGNWFKEKPGKTYILPTRFGLAFAVMATTLFMMAIGYSNNLIYIYVFLLISMAVTSMYVTNQNVKSLIVEQIRSARVFAAENTNLFIALSNRGRGDITGFSISTISASLDSELFDLSGGERNSFPFVYKFSHRGRQRLTPLKISTDFPFRILRAWKVIEFKESFLVFPKLEGESTLPDGQGRDEEGLGLFHSHREFQSYDSLQRVDWRASARQQNLLVKKYEKPMQKKITLTWEQTQHILDIEKRISQLALWLVQAQSLGREYSLDLPNLHVPQDKGVLHLDHCLEVLALYEWSSDHI